MSVGQPSTGGVSGNYQAWLGKKVLMSDAVNVRGVLTGNVLLTEQDSEFQTADAGGADRTWTLPPNADQGLRFKITNIGINYGFKIFDNFNNFLGTVPPQSSGFCSSTIVSGVWKWVFVSEAVELALQFRALLLTAYMNGGVVVPGVLEFNCKALGCSYTALQFAVAKS